MAISEEQFERLPLYAQREVQRLTADLESLRGKLAEMGDEEGHVRASITRYDGDLKLPKHTPVIFDLGDQMGEMENELRVKMDQDVRGRWYLEAYVSRNIVVHPYSSNIVRLYVE